MSDTTDVPTAKSPGALPTQVHHRSLFSTAVPVPIPGPSLVDSAGGAHYSGAKVDSGEETRASTTERGPGSQSVQQANHQRVIDDLRELYCCRPTIEILQRTWREDAEFEDPLVKCKGFNQYAPQWLAMPKIFSKSETISSRIMASTEFPNRLVYSQIQEYTLRYVGSKKKIESIISVDLDEEDKIRRLVEQWGGKEVPTRYGAHILRRANAVLTPWLVRVPKAHQD